MASCKKQMVEQVLRRISSGDRSVGFKVHHLEIEKAIEQQINALLRVQTLQGMNMDDNIPDGCVIATYDSVPVTVYNGVSKCTLPAMPVQLPKGMGVFHIGIAPVAQQAFSSEGDGVVFVTESSYQPPTDATNGHGNLKVAAQVVTSFIPIPPGQAQMLSSQPMLSDLLGQVGYEVYGKDVIFTRDLIHMSPAIPNVLIRLVVMDVSKYTDYEMLPITADQEAQVIEIVVKMFASEPTQPQIIDSTSDTK
jgi:hypothetical protein